MNPLYNTLQKGLGLVLDETAQWCEIERICRAINFAPLRVRKGLLVNLINFLAGWRLLNKSGKRSFSSDKLAKDVIGSKSTAEETLICITLTEVSRIYSTFIIMIVVMIIIIILFMIIIIVQCCHIITLWLS